jgi:hypothetical protein
MHEKLWWGNFLENVHMDDREADVRITLRRIVGRYSVRMEGGWNWLGIV